MHVYRLYVYVHVYMYMYTFDDSIDVLMGHDKPHMPPRQKCACVRGAPATVRGAADGGGGHAGMRSERATTTVHRLGHGSLATPRHDVAWTATVWGAMTQIDAIGGAAAAG